MCKLLEMFSEHKIHNSSTALLAELEEAEKPDEFQTGKDNQRNLATTITH